MANQHTQSLQEEGEMEREIERLQAALAAANLRADVAEAALQSTLATLETTQVELVAEREERVRLQQALALLAERYVLCILRPVPLSCGSQYRMWCPMQVP